jgi:hypothetical protein
LKRLAFLSSLLLASVPALGQQKTPEELARIRAESRYEGVLWPRPTLAFVPRIGAAGGDMGLTYTAGFQLAYAPPILEKRLAFAADIAWKPSSLNGPFSTYKVEVDEIAAAVAATWHAYSSTTVLVPFAGAGLGISARRAATVFPGPGTRNEREIAPAGFVSAGFELRAGPGTFETEARARYSPSRTDVLKGSLNSPFSFSFGYRFTLL